MPCFTLEFSSASHLQFDFDFTVTRKEADRVKFGYLSSTNHEQYYTFLGNLLVYKVDIAFIISPVHIR
jgi:hypothetical protein